MTKDNNPKQSRNWTRFIPALWSVEAIVIAGGLMIAALVGVLADSSFKAGLTGQGWAYVGTAIACALTPASGVFHIHALPLIKDKLEGRNRKT